MTRSPIIFHHVQPLTRTGGTGSSVRPAKMFKAFQDLGFEVEDVTGYGRSRAAAIARLKRDARRGRRYAFTYSESATIPTLLSEPHHFPLHPTLDFSFFKWMRRRGIPIGVFYRDVYWRFDVYKKVPLHKRLLGIAFHHYDWLRFRELADVLFLPSLEMKSALPGDWRNRRVSPLPPGCVINSSIGLPPTRDALSLFYVGSVEPPLYDLRPLLTWCDGLRPVVLTICCPRDQWERCKTIYEPLIGSRVNIVHEEGDDLAARYLDADAFVLIREPHPYLRFAMPVKVFEALGFGVPLIAAAGGAAGNFVADESVGWLVRDRAEFSTLVSRLAGDRRLLEDMRQSVRDAQERHTWRMRATFVAEVLRQPGHNSGH